MRLHVHAGLVLALFFASAGCSDDEADAAATSGAGGGGTGGAAAVDTVAVQGTVMDFETSMPIAGSATLSLSGLNQSEPPMISVTGSDFEVTGVAPFSAFHLLSGAPPDYRDTYNILTEVADQDVSGIEAWVVGETYLGTLEAAFGVNPASGTGIVIARAMAGGMPRAGVPAAAFTLGDAAPPSGPFFLDEALQPDAALTETSASGYVVFYDVPPGLTVFGAAMGSGFSITGPSSPVATGKVTLAELEVSDGEPVIPTNVSFAGDVVPIFEKRGCVACHSGNSIGADLGDLALNGGDNKIYGELTQEVSPTYKTTRVDLMMPETSLVLTMPSVEDPPDAHPNVTFAGPGDPDYLTLLGWIKEGAKQN